MSTPRNCQRCTGKLEAGFIPDENHSMVLQQKWVPGEPVRRRFIGGVKYDSRAAFAIVAYRCNRCGILELYAR